MNTTAYSTTLRGTAYEADDHTVHVVVTAELFELVKRALAFLNSTNGFQSVTIFDYPARVYVGFSEEDPDPVVTPPKGNDERVDYSELVVEKDGDVRWEYRIKHVDGCIWSAWGLTVADLTKHFEGA